MEAERQATSVNRKRRKAGAEAEDIGSSSKKAQRGRPKADTGDESAADRRRTQIRLAQRAYRQRKETTISTLSKQVSALQETIEELRESFTTFADFALGTDLPITHPNVALELSSTIEHVVQLCDDAKVTGAETKGSDSDGPNASERRDSQDQVVQPSVQISHDENWLNPTLSSMTMSGLQPNRHNPHQSVGLPMGYIEVYESNDDNIMDDVEEVNFQSFESQPDLSLTRALPNNDKNNYPWYTETHFSTLIDNPPIYPVIQPNTLAAFADTNFIHYLRQMTVVNGHFALSLEEANPQFVQRCFQLSFVIEPKEVVKAKFDALLHRTPADLAISDTCTALVHLGGAGTHYGQYQENAFAIKPGSNPWRARMSKTDGSGVSCEIPFDWDDLGGEWFEHSDVEGWLKERHIEYNSNTLMGDALVDAHEIPDEILTTQTVEDGMFFTSAPSAIPSPESLTSSGSTNSLGGSPLQASLPVASIMGFDLGLTSLFPPMKPYMIDPTGRGNITPATSSTKGLLYMPATKPLATDPVLSGVRTSNWANFGNFNSTGSNPPSPKRRVRVDLNKMVLELLTGGVCIGRAAAFRKVEVERAFRASIVSVT